MNTAAAKSTEAPITDKARENPYGHGPRSWKDYLIYPRVLFTLILCGLFFVLHVAYGIYALFFEK